MTVGSGRGGWLLIEILVAMALGIVVLGVLFGLVRGSLDSGRFVAERAEALETVRTIWVVLEEELGASVEGRDWMLDPEGTVVLRAFRGFGRACGSDAGVLDVAYRGQRLPDPDRDSLLVLTPDGAWTASPFEQASSTGSCTTVEGEREIGLSGLSAALTSPILVRVFERGSYHLVDGAFRYRRGGGGRQPLTAERLGEGSRFESTAGRVSARVEIDPDGGIGPFVWQLPTGRQ